MCLRGRRCGGRHGRFECFQPLLEIGRFRCRGVGLLSCAAEVARDLVDSLSVGARELFVVGPVDLVPDVPPRLEGSDAELVTRFFHHFEEFVMLGKTFNINERFRLEFRAEAFNLTNTPPLGNPNTSFGAPAFGSITTALDPRVAELVVKLHF